MKGLSSSYTVLVYMALPFQFQLIRTHLGNVFSMRRSSVGGDGTARQGSEGLTAERKSLTGPSSAEQHYGYIEKEGGIEGMEATEIDISVSFHQRSRCWEQTFPFATRRFLVGS